MNSFFELNSPASKFLTSVCNLILVNLIFIITSIPLVTIGASLCGLYKVVFEILNKEEVSVVKDYFKEFKRCFLKASMIWIPMFIILAFFALELYWVLSGMTGTSGWMVVPIVLVAVLIISLAIYYFPLLAIFDNTPKETIVNSILLSVGNFPTTIMVFIIHLVTFIILARGGMFSVILGSLMLFCGFSVIAFICAFFLRKTIPASTKLEYDDNEDHYDYTHPHISDVADVEDDED
ncbi:MAG: DUF624 domain-containing protein [Saccharofermentans sp.]|nr:DUF624 domain-containing protein [Saccharofermentans sp.]